MKNFGRNGQKTNMLLRSGNVHDNAIKSSVYTESQIKA